MNVTIAVVVMVAAVAVVVTAAVIEDPFATNISYFTTRRAICYGTYT